LFQNVSTETFFEIKTAMFFKNVDFIALSEKSVFPVFSRFFDFSGFFDFSSFLGFFEFYEFFSSFF
jgi:hypothetical protein